MYSSVVLFVTIAFIGQTLSAAVESPKSLDAAPLNANPERKNDLLINGESPEAEAEIDAVSDEGNSDLDSSATHWRPYRRAYYGGYGGYGGYGSYGGYGNYGGYGGYPYYGGYSGYGGYGHHRRGYYGGYPYYGGYGGYGHGGYGGYGGHRHGYYSYY